MNIKEAKNEIINTIKAYLKKDGLGRYIIPVKAQRPILMIGAPGIGKTALMEQIAIEMGLNLVSYSITHHTRQSALGLPYIVEKDGYSVTNYTMSEIIAEVYDRIEKTGIQEGILFLDEINCVSETLAPAILRFLQYKHFGTHKLPDGFVVVAAGNPPEYNKSVREFDIVTLDRMKKLTIEPSLEAWLGYALKTGVSGSIISYLNIKKENFYKVETTVDGVEIATARGWEDLSCIINVYEKEGVPLTFNEVKAYIQNTEIAKDFTIYYELYKKYENDYKIGEVLKGNVDAGSARRLGYGAFDEKLSIIGLLNSGLGGYFKSWSSHENFVESLYNILDRAKAELSASSFKTVMDKLYKNQQSDFKRKKQAGLLTRDNEACQILIGNSLKYYCGFDGFDEVKAAFAKETELLDKLALDTETALNSAFEFIEIAFGKGQEMVLFITGINMDSCADKFLRENENKKYIEYNKELLFEEKEKSIGREIEELRYTF